MEEVLAQAAAAAAAANVAAAPASAAPAAPAAPFSCSTSSSALGRFMFLVGHCALNQLASPIPSPSPRLWSQATEGCLCLAMSWPCMHVIYNAYDDDMLYVWSNGEALRSCYEWWGKRGIVNNLV